jgi:CBS-domain-containing membrane protein
MQVHDYPQVQRFRCHSNLDVIIPHPKQLRNFVSVVPAINLSLFLSTQFERSVFMLSKVLTVSSVMVKPLAVTYPKDGPKSALLKMKEEGISSVMVVNRERQFMGIVHVRDVRKASELNHKTLEEVLDRDVVSVLPDENISSLFSASKFPIAGVDEKGVLKGAVVRGSLLSALSSEGGAGNG